MNKSLLGIVLILMSPFIVKAWDCIMTPIQTHVKSTKYIVTGKVVKTFDTSIYNVPIKGRSALFAIDRVYKWKGRADDTIRLFTEGNFTSLTSFQLGQEYLFFLEEKNGKHYVRNCSYSCELVDADKYIVVLDSMLAQPQKRFSE